MFVIIMSLCPDEETTIIDHTYGPYISRQEAENALTDILDIYKSFPDDIVYDIRWYQGKLYISINHYNKIFEEDDTIELAYHIKKISNSINDITPDAIDSLIDEYSY